MRRGVLLLVIAACAHRPATVKPAAEVGETVFPVLDNYDDGRHLVLLEELEEAPGKEAPREKLYVGNTAADDGRPSVELVRLGVEPRALTMVRDGIACVVEAGEAVAIRSADGQIRGLDSWWRAQWVDTSKCGGGYFPVALVGARPEATWRELSFDYHFGPHTTWQPEDEAILPANELRRLRADAGLTIMVATLRDVGYRVFAEQRDVGPVERFRVRTKGGELVREIAGEPVGFILEKKSVVIITDDGVLQRGLAVSRRSR